MLVCSLAHGGVCGSQQSKIWIERPSLKVDVPVVCVQCEDPPCVPACPEGALRQLPNGSIEVSEEKCDACRGCVTACPYDAIRIVREVAVVCDLCGGDPLCAKYCPVDAVRVK
jgi:Fe-S-cluster-containing hydrogenase component 2